MVDNPKAFAPMIQTLSVITPVYMPVLSELRDCLESAQGPNVEHILVLDGDHGTKTVKAVRRLAKKYRAQLKILDTQVGISKASNEGVEWAKGDFLVFLDQDDFLAKNWWAPVMEIAETVDFIYSDCFHANQAGKATRLVRKPDWSPVRLMFNMFPVHFMAVRKSMFLEIGGFRSEYDGSQDHDLALRISRRTNRIAHIPVPLYFWRASQASTVSNPNNKSWAYDAGLEAAKDHLKVVAPSADLIKLDEFPGALQARFKKRTLPVSVVIPSAFKQSASGVPYISLLIDSLTPFLSQDLGDEIVVVHGKKDDSSSLAGSFPKDIPSKFVVDKEKFNFSRRTNIGFLSAKNDHVLLLNDDVEFGTEDPLNQLFGLLGLPNVGLVGGLLSFPDFTIQHGGHSFTAGRPNHAHYGSRSLDPGLFDLIIDHEVVGVTGALMFQLKSTWHSVGGFSAAFPLNFNDVDYCQKIRTLGFSIIQANSVVAFHHESVTRQSKVYDWEIDLLNTRWYDVLSVDDYSTV
jgi:GT2 family glycosyltransferase